MATRICQLAASASQRQNHQIWTEQRILQAAGQAIPTSKPIFEINPEHALIKRLHAETDDERFEGWTRILFDQAVLSDAGRLENPSDFVQRLNSLLLSLV